MEESADYLAGNIMQTRTPHMQCLCPIPHSLIALGKEIHYKFKPFFLWHDSFLNINKSKSNNC